MKALAGGVDPSAEEVARIMEQVDANGVRGCPTTPARFSWLESSL